MKISTYVFDEHSMLFKRLFAILLLIFSTYNSQAQNAVGNASYSISTNSVGESSLHLQKGGVTLLDEKIQPTSDVISMNLIAAQNYAQRAVEIANNCSKCIPSQIQASLHKVSNNSNTPGTVLTACTFTGSLAAGDLTMSPRLNRGGVATTCAATGVFPGTAGTGPYFYDVYTVTNPTASTECVNVSLTTTDAVNANIQSAAYLTTFNPASLSTNYLGDLPCKVLYSVL